MPANFEIFRRRAPHKRRWGYKTVPPIFSRETIHTIYLGRIGISWTTESATVAK